MSNPFAEATAAQRQAVAPHATVWVAASAGTGKTKVLVDRVLALLLAGSPPERILCLTYTKAAAAEMKNRLLARLADWATLAPERLTAQLYDLFGERPDSERENRARQLFAAVLDAPGGLKIQTLHGFCQSLLTRFPLEAGISPRFQLVEERTAAELLGGARADLLAAAEAPDGVLLRAALEELLIAGSEQGLNKMLDALVQRRAVLQAAFARYGGRDGAVAAHAALYDVALDETADSLLALHLGPALLPATRLRPCVAALERGGKTDAKAAAALAALLATAPEARPGLWPDYRAIFLTGEGYIRERLASKGALAALPGLDEVLRAEAERVEALDSRLAALRLMERTRALLVVGHALLGFYAARKARHGALDYDDLIAKAAELLQDEGRAAWVLYKLDGGLDHLLIDEAQDTSPAQWQVVRRLTGEFYAGAGAHEDEGGEPRTVFAVGDAKQSIYRFQGADPEGFRSAESEFAARAEAARLEFRSVPLSHSFRSVEAVLSLVDAVAARVDLTGGQAVRHAATRLGQGGSVALWPVIAPVAPAAAEPWSPPLARSEAQDPAVALAERIAGTIQGWLAADPAGVGPGHPAFLDSRGRPIQAGDILILVRRRGALFEAMNRALKRRGVPVAGVDRMVLPQQLAVMDLVALGRFLLLPDDDLTLAVVLKGPMFGFDDEDLFALAHERSASLWEALGARAAGDPRWLAARDELAALQGRADFVPPFELFAEVLSARRGRPRWRARLGEEAEDPLDEFLAQAQAYEREHAPSLEGFLDWLEQGELQVKRDLESGGQAVRLMTVHGAKGLQAPIVFLPDSTVLPKAREDLLADADRALLVPWTSAAKAVPEAALLLEREQRAVEAEYRRLLYVAMTRAEDRLIVCGHVTRGTPGPDCWHAMVEAAIRTLEPETDAEGVLTVARPQLQVAARKAEKTGEVSEPLGAFAFQAPPAEPTPPRPLAPSRPSGPEPATLSPLAGIGAGGAGRFRRGLIIHRLLQSLPDLPQEKRPAAARRFLAEPAQDLTAEEQESWAAETLAVLADPAAAALFGPASRAEVPVAGLAGGTRVAGQIDRLAVTDEAVLIADYKTNRPPPPDPSGVPALYWRQMAAYRSLLAQVYPGRALRCYLLWTDGPRLMQLCDEGLDRHMP